MKTYSLAEVAEIALPPEWKNPERWLRERLNRKEIRGYKTGRTWRLTHAHLEALIMHLSNKVESRPVEVESVPVGSVSILNGLSARARDRMLA